MAQRKVYEMSKLAAGQSASWLQRQYRLALKAANDRIKTTTGRAELREHAQAYEKIIRGDLMDKKYIAENKQGVARFVGLGKGASKAELLEALKAAERFLGAKTSTARGIKETLQERRQALNDYVKEDWENRGGAGPAPELSKDDADNILRWLGSPEGQEAKRNFDSHQVREAIAKRVIADRMRGDRRDVSAIYNDFMTGNKTWADYIRSSEKEIENRMSGF